MPDFWTRKKEELQEQGVIPVPRPQPDFHGPWWQVAPEARQAAQQPQGPSQPPTGASGTQCPHCSSGNYMKPSPSISARCFDCGYTAGRQLNELELPGIASPDANKLKVKQIDTGGHFGRSVAEINHNNQVLEQSASGRAKLN
jgi:hypothetical protein